MNGIHMYRERFHGKDLANWRDSSKSELTWNTYRITQTRELSYRFFLHQHPYVQPLLQRLVRRGTAALQAADTEFHLRLRLDAAVAARAAGGELMTLATGRELALDEGSTFTTRPAAGAGAGVRVAGSRLVGVADDLPVTLAAAGGPSAVSVPVGAVVRLTDGSALRLEAAAQATLIDGAPRPRLYTELFDLQNRYQPSALVAKPWPVKELDFSSGGAYAVYNWELFFHVPFTIALHLSRNQRFADAQRWLHLLFDPTDDSDGPTPERFWKLRPFQTTDVHRIEDLLVNLVTGADEPLRRQTVRSLEAWRDAPFKPHVIARYRQQAYMLRTVMAYLDNLVAWGDSLFRQDTGEAIDEAMMLYVLAANILGPRPLPVPRQNSVRPQTYANLRNDLRLFGTVMRELEPALPFDLMPEPDTAPASDAQLATLRSVGQALYFCVPRNDKLLGYWDTVADRLFKIRNSLNIQGAFRQLALFEPPIDPALLARAAASGLDVGAVLAGLNQPLPLVRFTLLVQKASEVAQEVKSLGNGLLQAMEKEDGEALALLRARHERSVLELVERVRYGQWQEAIKSREALARGLAVAAHRYRYYEKLLGRSDEEIEVPEIDELDRAALAAMKLRTDEPLLEPREENLLKALVQGQIPSMPINTWEAAEMLMLTVGHVAQAGSAAMDLVSAGLALIPEAQVRATPVGVGGGVTYGGKAISTAVSFGARALNAVAADANFMASMTAKVGGYVRRAQEWEQQSNAAAGEIGQILKQLRAAQIREAVAELELKNHQRQMKHAEEIERFLNAEGQEKTGKKTHRALYAWMKREVRGLYAQVFQLAFDIARMAERALQHELGRPELTYLQQGYLAGREGLLAGERLWQDIKRMELAYHEQNQREYELTKSVSLLQIDPLELVKLRQTGRCRVTLPESLFDMDGPGHYFRRIRSVALSIPCVTGPYTSVPCTATLLQSRIRRSAAGADHYPQEAEDERFSEHRGSLQAIVTSSAQNDSGLFEANLRDERYLPFENAGVIGEWQLQLPADPSKGEPTAFDYATIADVVLHLRYTAREGGEQLRRGAMTELRRQLADAEAAGSVRLFSLSQEFPTEWTRFRTQAPTAAARAELAVTLRPEHYPLCSRGHLGGVERIGILVRSSAGAVPAALEVHAAAAGASAKESLARSDEHGKLLVGSFSGGPAGFALPAAAATTIQLFFADAAVADVMLAVAWKRS
jgi:hypothetical protein